MDLLHVLRPSCKLNSMSDCLDSLLHSCLGMEILVPALGNGIRTWKDSDHHHCLGQVGRGMVEWIERQTQPQNWRRNPEHPKMFAMSWEYVKSSFQVPAQLLLSPRLLPAVRTAARQQCQCLPSPSQPAYQQPRVYPHSACSSSLWGGPSTGGGGGHP